MKTPDFSNLGKNIMRNLNLAKKNGLLFTQPIFQTTLFQKGQTNALTNNLTTTTR